jgi:hypothetical protein
MQQARFRGFIPRRYEILLFSFLLSMFMSFLVSGVSTMRTIGISDDLPLTWARNFVSSWVVAFPAVMIVAPVVRRLVKRLLIEEV